MAKPSLTVRSSFAPIPSLFPHLSPPRAPSHRRPAHAALSVTSLVSLLGLLGLGFVIGRMAF